MHNVGSFWVRFSLGEREVGVKGQPVEGEVFFRVALG